QSWIGNQGWEPIGSSTYFRGTYDGDGFEIIGLYINRPDGYDQGLFGMALAASIRNLSLSNVSVNAESQVGALVANGRTVSIQNCSSSGEINISSDNYQSYAGGLLGFIDSNSQIISCFSECTIVATNQASIGGLIGYLYSSSVDYCGSSGTIDGMYTAGGLIGEADRSQISRSHSGSIVNSAGSSGGLIGRLGDWSGVTSTVSECYFDGSVNGISGVGGLVGNASGYISISNSYNAGGASGTSYVGGAFGYVENVTINNCHSYGAVTGDEETGGLIGYNTDSSVTRSYWDTQSSGLATSAGGINNTTAEMQDVMTFLVGGWDIKGAGSLGIWNQGNGRNNGYPYLDWEYPDDPANPAVTMPYAPVLSTQACTEIGATSAVFNGTIISLGNPAASTYGFCWNTSGEPTIADNLVDLGAASESGAFSALIESLSMNTLYYA
ncbi:MAG TPA: GLUG motif-containing protein, partial [Candidatus Cloacimonadota bacterium]|nr:GLUG motif-containing protein [Candidatus Cloacimonadota bacterium]